MNLIYFVHVLANHRPNGALFTEFLKAHPLSKQENQLLDKFETRFGDSGGKYYHYIQLEQLALHSNDTIQLRRKLRDGSMDSVVALEALNTFGPLYEKFVSRDRDNNSQKKIKELRTKYTDALSSASGEVEQFLKCDLDTGEPVTVAVVMVPTESVPAAGHDAHACPWSGDGLESYCVVEFRSDATADDVIGTIMHELVHEIWNRRSPEIESELDKWFALSHGQGAMKFFPEALPTAIGSGWFATKVTGKPAQFWYSIPNIRDLAKGIEPLCANYLNERRSIDENFVKNVVAAFSKISDHKEAH